MQSHSVDETTWSDYMVYALISDVSTCSLSSSSLLSFRSSSSILKKKRDTIQNYVQGINFIHNGLNLPFSKVRGKLLFNSTTPKSDL